MPLMLQNFILFQIGWFGCVISGASENYYWAGIPIVTFIVAVHLARAVDMRNEIVLIILTMIVGTTWDSMLTAAGFFEFANGVYVNWLVPLWLVSMWALFATTLNVSLKWLKDRYVLAAVFGAIGGPVAYYAGHRIGAVDFDNTLNSMIAVGAGWAVIMPVLMLIANRYNGYLDISRHQLEAKLI
jgi:hypothetical protein